MAHASCVGPCVGLGPLSPVSRLWELGARRALGGRGAARRGPPPRGGVARGAAGGSPLDHPVCMTSARVVPVHPSPPTTREPCRMGRKDRKGSSIDAASHAMLEKSEECAALNLHTLDRVPFQERHRRYIKGKSFANLSWARGHFPYPTCSRRHGRPGRPMTVLMVADFKYTQLIPSWAAMVRSLGYPCAVGDVGDTTTRTRTANSSMTSSAAHDNGVPTASTALSACEAAAAAGCECFQPPVRAKTAVHRWSLEGVMAMAVRWRFLYARQLLLRGQSVLMHDADVIFRPRGLAAMKAWVANAPPVDFAVQDNGARPETYDDLNWGFTWMSGSKTTVRLLGCLLNVWTHAAFAAPLEGPRASKAYYARSQPRINHIVEAAIEHARSPSAAPRVCMFSANLLQRTMRHFSGYVNPNHKIMCARALGVLNDTPDSLRRQLVYRVPTTATLEQQKHALAAAIHLGESLQMGISIPQASYNGRHVPFCHLFDVLALPQQHLLTFSLAIGNKQLLKSVCAAGKVNASALRSQQFSPQPLSGHNATFACVSFDSLVRLGKAGSHGIVGLREVKSCDPMLPCIMSGHGCYERIWKPSVVGHGTRC